MGLNERGFSETAFHDVGVNGALHEIIDFSDLLSEFFKHANELFADDLPLFFGFGHAVQTAQKAFGGVDFYHVHALFFFENAHNLFRFVLTEQAVIDEHARQVVADGFIEHRCRDRAIHAAAHRAQDFFVPDFLFQFFYFAFHEAFHRPIAFCAADLIQKVFQHFYSVHGVHDFGVELYTV